MNVTVLITSMHLLSEQDNIKDNVVEHGLWSTMSLSSYKEIYIYGRIVGRQYKHQDDQISQNFEASNSSLVSTKIFNQVQWKIFGINMSRIE